MDPRKDERLHTLLVDVTVRLRTSMAGYKGTAGLRCHWEETGLYFAKSVILRSFWSRERFFKSWIASMSTKYTRRCLEKVRNGVMESSDSGIVWIENSDANADSSKGFAKHPKHAILVTASASWSQWLIGSKYALVGCQPVCHTS